MTMVRVAEFSLGADLSPISNALDARQIDHRLMDEEGVTVLYVDSEAPVDEVIELIKAAMAEIDQQQGLMPTPSLRELFQRIPATMICLLLSILGAMVPEWLFPLLHWLTMQDFILVSPTQIAFSTLSDGLAEGQWWRLITPIFIHFGLIHIVFNGLWLWEFGKRIETLAGTVHFLLLVVVIGIASNLGQYLWSGPSLFGGMSGVVYGLLGYIWVRNKLAPHPAFDLPTGILVVMIGWLLVCMTGLIDLLMQGSVANAAHAVGLAVGMALGAVFGLVNRRIPSV